MSATPQIRAPRKVLVFDDEIVIADTLGMILESSGYNVRVCYRADDAVAQAHTFIPDIIVGDVFMPGKNGIEAALEIHSFLPGCRILLLSGQGATAALLEQTTLQDQGVDIMSKPIRPEELLARLAA